MYYIYIYAYIHHMSHPCRVLSEFQLHADAAMLMLAQAVTQATSLAAQQVVVAMKIFAADPLAMPLPVPDSTSLAAQLGQQLGMDVVVTIENEASLGIWYIYIYDIYIYIHTHHYTHTHVVYVYN